MEATGMEIEKMGLNKGKKVAAANGQSVLRALGIVGYDAIESVIIASLATEAPLLLIGPHGTTKSLLLNWLAEALSLEHRHYNASQVNFDDLVGFPLPNAARTGLEYLRTKGAIWGAQSVFIDEISRTRLDMQNRLFPIIHEKAIQGIPLPDLLFRWAAMNPPHSEEDEANDDGNGWTYAGSEPLDVALADRFPFVVQLPSFDRFSDADKMAVIRGEPAKEKPGAGDMLRRQIQATKLANAEILKSSSPQIGSFVHALLPLLEKIKRPVSPRRARMIHDNVAAVIAAEQVAGRVDIGAAAFLALANSLPCPAHGLKIDQAELLAVHRQAWKLAEIPPSDPRRLVFAESDPVKRVALGLQLSIPDLDLSTLVMDAVATLEPVERICLSANLWPVVSTTRNLTATAFETLAADWQAIEDQSERRHSVSSGSKRHRQWQTLADWISDRRKKTLRDRVFVGSALVLFDREIDFAPKNLEKAFKQFAELFPWQEEA